LEIEARYFHIKVDNIGCLPYILGGGILILFNLLIFILFKLAENPGMWFPFPSGPE
jgi:hypothetical protein